MTTRAALLAAARRKLSEAGVDNAALDARILLQHALQLDDLDLVRAPEAEVEEDAASRLAAFIARRMAGEPAARILGAKEFFGLSFALSEDTLVPRPQTELIVEEALRLFSDRDAPLRVLDLGTGTGCILLSLLHERPSACGFGVDRSFGAACAARANATALGLGARANFIVGDWAASVRGPFDLLVSNPPYIPSGDISSLAREVSRHDPILALDGGEDGLAPHVKILNALPRLMRPGGAALLEIGYDQGGALRRLAAERRLTPISILSDLAGLDRVAVLSL